MSNYTEINIAGQKVGLKFAFPQYKEFSIAIATNPDMCYDASTQEITAYGLTKLIQSAYKNDCLIKERPTTVTLEQISDWVDSGLTDESVQSQIAELVSVWQNSEYTKLWLKEVKKKTEELQNASQQMKLKKSTKGTKRRSTIAVSDGES